jgi:hypothetical protein
MPYTARSSTYWSQLQCSRFAAKDRSFEKPLSGCPALDEARDHRWRARCRSGRVSSKLPVPVQPQRK